jgi:hypothetical protein
VGQGGNGVGECRERHVVLRERWAVPPTAPGIGAGGTAPLSRRRRGRDRTLKKVSTFDT